MHIPITTLATYVSSIVPVGKSVVGAIGSNVLAKETAVERRVSLIREPLNLTEYTHAITVTNESHPEYAQKP